MKQQYTRFCGKNATKLVLFDCCFRYCSYKFMELLYYSTVRVCNAINIYRRQWLFTILNRINLINSSVRKTKPTTLKKNTTEVNWKWKSDRISRKLNRLSSRSCQVCRKAKFWWYDYTRYPRIISERRNWWSKLNKNDVWNSR